MLKRINDALPGLVFGIVFYGIVVQLIGVWFVTDKISYSIGLWYGIAIAVGMAVRHIWTKGCQSQDRSKITFKVYCCCGPVIYIGTI